MVISKRGWVGRAALVSAGLIAIGVLYVLFASPSKPDLGGYARFAHGALAGLQAEREPSPQPSQILFDSEGRQLRLADRRGRLTLVNYWATWCAPCVEEMPTLGALQRRFQGRLLVLPVSVDGLGDTAKAKVELARLSEGALAFYQEPTRAIMFDAHIAGMPTSVLYDHQGRELARVSGRADWSSDEAAALIEAALSQE